MDSVIRRVERARSEGLDITADMYTYIAGATGMTSAFPPTLQDGGFGKLRERLRILKIRKANGESNEYQCRLIGKIYIMVQVEQNMY